MSSGEKEKQFRYEYLDREVETAQSRRREKRQLEVEKKQSEKKSPRELKAMARNRRLFWALLLAAAFTVLAVARTAVSIIELSGKEADAKAELEALTRKRDQLEEELKEVESQEYAEQEARSELRMIYPDEYLYIVESGEDAAEPESTQEDSVSGEASSD